MVFNSKNNSYKEGETRIVKKFAWMPVRISDKVVFIGFYEVLQVYNVITYVVLIENKPTEFTVGNWINISSRCK